MPTILFTINVTYNARWELVSLHYTAGAVSLVEHKLILILLEKLTRPLLIQKQAVNPLDIFDGYFRPLPLLTDQAGHRYELYGVPQTGLTANLRKNCESLFRYFGVVLLTSDLQDLPELFLFVHGGGDDDGPVQQVQGHTMGAGVLSASDLSDTPVSCHHNYWSHVVF